MTLQVKLSGISLFKPLVFLLSLTLMQFITSGPRMGADDMSLG